MSFLKRWFSRGTTGQDVPGTFGEAEAANPERKRSFGNLAPAEDEAPGHAPAMSRPERGLGAARTRGPSKAPTPPANAVSESVSVIMRRQVPIRFDEEARSWLGGLPQMPVGTEWPRAGAKKPLQFVAQIDCAAVPKDLWGGLGPREGWLLLFVDFEAVTDELKRPFARVLHVPELGPEAEPPAGLYFARNDVFDVASLPNPPRGAQRRHFRKWPIDLVPTAADTSELTGSELYGAPEDDHGIIGPSAAGDCPMTWRGAYSVLAELVQRHSAKGYESRWTGNALGLLDYPEPDVSGRNKEWQQRRERIAEQLPRGYHCPEFWQASERLEAQLYEERRKGWTQRAFKVLEAELATDTQTLGDYRAKAADARARGDDGSAHSHENSIEYFEKKFAKHLENKAYLEKLFARYPSEEALVAEINRVGRAHLEWAQQTQDRLRDLLTRAATMDLDAPLAPSDWDAIVAEIATMKSEYWIKSMETDLLRKVERGVHIDVGDVLREEVLDRYVSPPTSADGLDPATIADLEPRLRHLESGHPHKLGGSIDSVYGDPLKKGHVLLFQLASDAATGWTCGDLGFVYVSIPAGDLEAGSFDNVKAWLEA